MLAVQVHHSEWTAVKKLKTRSFKTHCTSSNIEQSYLANSNYGPNKIDPWLQLLSFLFLFCCSCFLYLQDSFHNDSFKWDRAQGPLSQCNLHSMPFNKGIHWASTVLIMSYCQLHPAVLISFLSVHGQNLLSKFHYNNVIFGLFYGCFFFFSLSLATK